MSEFNVGADGVRVWNSTKVTEILQRYLKLCGDAFILTETPLLKALEYRGVTVIEADNPFVFLCHLKTALAFRKTTDLAWDMVTPDTLMNRFIDGGSEIQLACVEAFDPLVVQAFSWPKYLKASEHIGHVLQTRTASDRPTLFVVRSLQDLPTNAMRFNPELLKWLKDCPKLKLTVGSVTAKARNREKASAYLKANPGFTKPLRPVLHTEPAEDDVTPVQAPAPKGKSSSRVPASPGRPTAEDCGVEPAMRRKKFGQKP